MSIAAPERDDLYPVDEEFQKLINKRTRRGQYAQIGFLSALSLAILALATLLYTIINNAFGYVAIVNERNPEDVVAEAGYDAETTTLGDLSKDELVVLLEGAVSSGVGRRLEREQRFYDDRLVFETQAVWDEICAEADAPEGCSGPARGGSDVLTLVQERVIVPDVIASAQLLPSVLNPEGFEQDIREAFEATPQRFGDYTVDDVRFEWRSWLTWTFVTSSSNSTPEIAGIRTAALGSLWLGIITILFAVPVGVGAAIYLVEFAKPSRFNGFIQTNINNLAGVPSIIYGMLGLAVFVAPVRTDHLRRHLHRRTPAFRQRPHDPLGGYHTGTAHPASDHHQRPGGAESGARLPPPRRSRRSVRPSGRPSGARCCRWRSRES